MIVLRRSILLFALALLFGGCRSAPAPDFIRLEEKWIAALQQRDLPALRELLDDSFVDSTFQGTLRTKDDVLGGSAAGSRYRSVRLDDVRVRRYGSATAIVTGVNVLQGPNGGELVRVRFTDVFRKIRGRWRAVTAQETLITN